MIPFHHTRPVIVVLSYGRARVKPELPVTRMFSRPRPAHQPLQAASLLLAGNIPAGGIPRSAPRDQAGHVEQPVGKPPFIVIPAKDPEQSAR